MSTTDLDALRLHVRYDEGEGPVIVLLHGINSDATDWRVVIDRIGPGYRCIAPDVLGFGESPKPTDIDYTADEHALVLENTLRDLGVCDPFLLVGYSLGGDIAVRYASTWPDRLRRLFLLSAPFYLPQRYYARRRFGPEYFQEIMFQGIWSAVARQKRDGTRVYSLVTGRLEDFAKGFLRTDDVGEHWDIMSKNLENTIAAATFVDDLPRLTMPTVFALGVRDPIVQPDQTPALKLLKPDIEIRRLVGLTADHFMLMNVPELVADEIMRDEVDGLNVVWRGGHGEPLVLLHGIDNNSGRWRPAAEVLARNNSVVVLDLLGFGASPQPLSSHYTLADHTAAVLATARLLFPRKRIRIAGHGFGALVALGCAATAPGSVSEVIAFSPTLVPPGTDIEQLADSAAVASIVASRESLMQLARDERAQTVSSERLERRVVPSLRSTDAVLATNAYDLLARVSCRVRFVAPADDDIAPRTWLRALADTSERFTLVEPVGGRDLPFEVPAEAVSGIDPEDSREIMLARDMRPVKRAKGSRVAELLGGYNALLWRRGLIELAGGMVLLALPQLRPSTVILAWAGYLFVEAVQTISGAIGLKRQGKGWLGWLLVGLASALFAVAVLAQWRFAWLLTGLALVVWLVGRGVANLVVARRVEDAPANRAALVAEGLLGVGLGIGTVFLPAQTAAELLRYTLGGYLAVGGAITTLYAWSVHRSTRARIRVLLASERHGRRA